MEEKESLETHILFCLIYVSVEKLSNNVWDAS